MAPSGEDIILYCKKCDFSQNKEIAIVQRGNRCPKCGGDVESSPAIEVANVFKLGTRYADAFNLRYTDEHGSQRPVIMGSYGIGPSRLMATLVEVSHDDRGILWPDSVAPYRVYLAELRGKGTAKRAKQVYEDLQAAGIEVLYDDRDVSAGEKFADADLLGIPWRVIVSEKAGAKAELKRRNAGTASLVAPSQLRKIIMLQ